MVLHIIVKIFEKVGKAQFRPSKILYTIISHIPKFAELLSDYDNNDDDELFCVTVLLWGLFKPWQLTFTCSQPRSLPKVLIISNLRYVASRIWTCAKFWIKLCSHEEHYIRNNKPQGLWKNWQLSVPEGWKNVWLSCRIVVQFSATDDWIRRAGETKIISEWISVWSFLAQSKVLMFCTVAYPASSE